MEESEKLFLDFGNILKRDYNYPFTGAEAEISELGYLTSMVLYVEIAWADGIIQDEELHLLGGMALIMSLENSLPNVPFVMAGMLKRRPDPEMFSLALKLVALTLNKTPDLLRSVLTQPFAQGAYDIAKSAGKGLFKKVDENEKEVMRKFFTTINFGNTTLIEKLKRKVGAE